MKKRWPLILGTVLVLGLALAFALGAFGTSSPKDDQEQIKELTTELAEAYNDEDWERFTARMVSKESREALERRFSKYARFSAIQTPPEFHELVIEEGRASLKITVRPRLPIEKWSRTGTIVFIRKAGEWVVDADASFEGLAKP